MWVGRKGQKIQIIVAKTYEYWALKNVQLDKTFESFQKTV